MLSTYENCISFEIFLNLRTFDRERLALTQAKKRCTEKSFFFRVECIINDAADLLNVSISFFKDTCKTATQNLLMAMGKDKDGFDLSCTWYLRCRCSFCTA